MFEEETNKIYNLIISNGYDTNNEYGEFVNKLYMKTNFLWKESISGSYKLVGEEFYGNVDCIILLAGLYEKNKELFEDLLEASEKYEVPVVLVRPYGLEEVPEKLEKKATSIVGWNANCIIDSILSSIKECSSYCD
ncbi:MAG: nuclease [archaeon]|nr:nuclease [archaeon]